MASRATSLFVAALGLAAAASKDELLQTLPIGANGAPLAHVVEDEGLVPELEANVADHEQQCATNCE